MINMIKMDLYRLFRTKSMYVIWIILLASALLTSFLSKKDYDAVNKEWEQQQEGKEFVRNNTDFLNLVTRKYSSGAAAAAAKMRTEPNLYLPVNQGDIDVNDKLHQNPAYKADDEYKKNY